MHRCLLKLIQLLSVYTVCECLLHRLNEVVHVQMSGRDSVALDSRLLSASMPTGMDAVRAMDGMYDSSSLADDAIKDNLRRAEGHLRDLTL